MPTIAGEEGAGREAGEGGREAGEEQAGSAHSLCLHVARVQITAPCAAATTCGLSRHLQPCAAAPSQSLPASTPAPCVALSLATAYTKFIYVHANP